MLTAAAAAAAAAATSSVATSTGGGATRRRRRPDASGRVAGRGAPPPSLTCVSACRRWRGMPARRGPTRRRCWCWAGRAGPGRPAYSSQRPSAQVGAPHPLLLFTADCCALVHPRGHGPWPSAHGPWPSTHCPLPIAHCPLPIAHCTLPITHCPLPIAHCSRVGSDSLGAKVR